MKNPRKRLIALYVTFAISLVAVIAVGSNLTSAVKSTIVEDQKMINEVPQDTKQIEKSEESQPSEIQQPESAPEVPQVVETYQQPSQPQTAAETPKNEAPAAHIPFTNKPVTAGDPESYVGTVGQCPFYEMAGEKGCVPPPDIECNADWSECHLKGENK